MGKDDRYDFDGTDDDLGSGDEPPTAETDERESNTSQTTADTPPAMDDTTTASSDAQPGQQTDEIPHRVRHDSPKEERTAKTVYFDTEDLSTIRDLTSAAEDEFEETVYDLDVYLAAFRSDLSEASFLEEMRSIGYGYFD